MPNTSIYKSPFNCFIKLQGRKTPLQCHRDYIVNHSKNIIDLIEAGDYVNGSKLISIDYAEDRDGNCDKLHYYYTFEDLEKDINEYYETLKINSIVTKEQFASMEYRLEG